MEWNCSIFESKITPKWIQSIFINSHVSCKLGRNYQKVLFTYWSEEIGDFKANNFRYFPTISVSISPNS